MPSRAPSFDDLELLVGIDDHGSLSAAARVVGMSQPNVSRAMSKLERQLSLPLILRSTSGSVLTAEGTVVAHWARRVLADVAKLRDVAAGLRVDRSAELTVAASMTVAEHLMPLWLGSFRYLHQDMTIHLQVYNSVQVCERVGNGACDVGFIESPTVARGLHSAAVARDRLVVVVDTGHRWARMRRALSVAELASTPLIVREPGSGTRTTLELAMRDYPMVSPLIELGSASAIRTSVLNGVGPAVLSTLAVVEQVKSGDLRVVDVDGLDLRRSLRAVWRPPRQLHGPAGELVRHVRRERRDDDGTLVREPSGP